MSDDLNLKKMVSQHAKSNSLVQ